MRRRSSILYIPPTTFALPLPLLTSPLPSSLWQADSRHWPLTLCLLSREKVTVYMCVCLGVYTYFLYICVRVCRSICARVICVWTASRVNIQPKIKTHLSASSGYVCVCVCALIFCACIYVSLCYSVRRWAWDGEVYLVCAVNGDKRHRGGARKGGVEVPHVEKYQVFNADMI